MRWFDFLRERERARDAVIPDALREANAMRRVFARIIRLGLSQEGDLSALYRAAAAELIADQEEGVTL